MEHEASRRKAAIINLFRDRPPLFIFAGDVGTGKTALAETFGDAVARESNIRIALYALSLTARGTGAVGEMTSLLSAAFNEVKDAARKGSGRGGKHNSGIILLIDEADASGAVPRIRPDAPRGPRRRQRADSGCG